MAQPASKVSTKPERPAIKPAASMTPREFADQTLDLIDQFGCQPTPQAYELFFSYAANHPPELREAVDEATGEDGILRTFHLERIHLEHFRSAHSDWELQESAAELVESSLGQTTSLLDRNLLNGKRFDQRFKTASDFMSDEPEQDKMRVFVDSMLLDSMEIHRSQLEIATQISMMRDKLVSMQTDMQGARQDSQNDALSGLCNRRYFDVTLRREVEKATSNGTPLALTLMRVDNFERMVDRIGRPIGDALLRLLGTRIKETTGTLGLQARVGNEDFAILMSDDAAGAAPSHTEALRQQIANKNFSIRGSSSDIGPVTMSCAVCNLKRGEATADFLGRAYELLSDAQFQGGNMVLK